MIEHLLDRCIIRTDGCVGWEGAVSSTGRPHFGRNGKTLMVLRVLYEEFIGPIPDGHLLHHECENKWCVNPYCVRPITPADHLRLHGIHLAGSAAAAEIARARTHCRHGHEFTVENTVWHYGHRSCRVCRAAASRRSYRKRAAAMTKARTHQLSVLG